MRLFGFCFLLILTLTRLYAQSPVADFSLPAQRFCQNETIFLENKSMFSTDYMWDFCSGDFENFPVAGQSLTSSLLKTVNHIEIYQENIFSHETMIFIPSGGSKDVFRIKSDDQLSINVNEIKPMFGSSLALKRPIDISIVKLNEIYYGYLIDFEDNKVYELNFGTDLASTSITVRDLGGFGFLNGPYSVKAVVDNGVIKVVITNYSSSNVVLLERAPNNEFIAKLIPAGVARGRGVDIIRFGNNWYGAIAVSVGNAKCTRFINFGNSLSSNIESAFSFQAAETTSPNHVQFVVDSGVLNAIVQENTGNLWRINLGKNFSSTPTYQIYGNLGVLNINNRGFDIIQNDQSEWIGLTVQLNNTINKFKFKNNCSSQIGLSQNTDPNIFYSQPGEYTISLSAYDEFGNRDDTTQFITVTENQAPTIDIDVSSLCINTQSFLSAISNQSLISANWTINGEAKAGDTVSYTFPSPGTYPITLQVQSADGCANRLTKEITIYEPPVPGFAIPQGMVCTNGAVAFTNQTDTRGADNLITYAWDFNGEGSSTAAHPSFVFTTGGMKTVTLTASVPGCEQTYSQTITIEEGPQVDFAVPFICQGSPTTFENLTDGTNITQYRWNFGDGGLYTSTTAETPVYIYQSTGSYTVTLTVENTIGCVNTRSRQVIVYAQPQVAFLAEVACAGKPVRFTDQTNAGSNANVVTWQWDFGDGKGKANIRNPTYTYQQPGTYAVTLTTQTSAGCQASRVQQITVASPVATAFSYAWVCPAVGGPYTVLLSDQSVVAAGDQLTSWLWRIGGEAFFTRDVQYTFQQPGTYEVSLTAFAASACYATVTQTIEILPPPEVAFRFVPTCAGEPFSFVNETDTAGVAIDRYSWDFGAAGQSFETDADFAFATPGSYAVTLSAHTVEGCVYTAVQTVEVPARPKARFTASAAFGGAPLLVQFINQSTDASQYVWHIGTDTLTEESPSYTFEQPGNYTVTLQAQNETGCVATATQTIRVVDPIWDLVLENIRLVTDTKSGSRQIILTIRNAGTLTVRDFPVSIRIDQRVEVQEMFTGYLKPGERINHTVTFTLPAQPISLGYLCATLLNGEGTLPDSHLPDNRACVNMESTFSSLLPYPNPVKDVLDVSLILPDAQLVKIIVENAQGKQLRARTYHNTKPGLNIFPIDCSGFPHGTYFVHIYYQDKKQTYRILVST